MLLGEPGRVDEVAALARSTVRALHTNGGARELGVSREKRGVLTRVGAVKRKVEDDKGVYGSRHGSDCRLGRVERQRQQHGAHFERRARLLLLLLGITLTRAPRRQLHLRQNQLGPPDEARAPTP